MNNITLAGHLVNVATKLRGTYENTELQVRTVERAKDGDKNETHTLQTFGRSADRAKTIAPGAFVIVTGRVTSREYADKQTGELRSFTSITCYDIEEVKTDAPKQTEFDVGDPF